MTQFSRRSFIQLSMAATATALSGCKNEAIWKEEATGQYGGTNNKVYPYVNQPEGTIDGVPMYFSTTCQMCSAGCGLFVRTLGGRANKVEGNPYHPVNLGKTCLRGELSLQHLYNPDRLMHPAQRFSRLDNFSATDWSTVMDRTVSALAVARGRSAILVDGAVIARSPSKMRLITRLSQVAHADLISLSVMDDAPWRRTSQAIYGRDQIPDYRLDRAELIVSFGGNFLEAWPSPVRLGSLFGEFRQGSARAPGDHGEFIYIGPRLSMTAARADQWLPCNPGSEPAVALAVLNLLGHPGIAPEAAADASGISVPDLTRLATKFKSAGDRCVALGGDGLYSSEAVTEAFAAVELLNVVTKSQCVEFGESLNTAPPIKSGLSALQQLIAKMELGEIDALVTIGQVNPAYVLPGDEGWNQVASKVPFAVSLGSFIDETSFAFDALLPVRTFLEEWSDHTPSVLPSGYATASMIQPTIDPSFICKRGELGPSNEPVPLMDTRETNDVLLDLINRLGGNYAASSSADSVRLAWAKNGGLSTDSANVSNSPEWVETVSRGGRWKGKLQQRSTPKYPVIETTFAAQTVPPGQYRLVLFPHIYYDDGRHANLGWVQEMPDPMSGSVWNSWVEINPETAHRLGIRTGDLVRLTNGARSVEVHALPFPGIHPLALAMPIGQGHTSHGRYSDGRGANPFDVVTPVSDKSTGAFVYSGSLVTLAKITDAQEGYQPGNKTLVLVQDRPHGAEPPAVKGLIHETAAEWKASVTSPASAPTARQRSKPVI